MAKRRKSKGKSKGKSRRKSRGKSRGRTKAARSRAAKKGWVTRRSRGLSASLGLARHRSYGMTISGPSKSKKKETYEIIVGNMGTVLRTSSFKEAHEAFREYVTQSKTNYGRAAGEDVVITEDGEPLNEYVGTQHD